MSPSYILDLCPADFSETYYCTLISYSFFFREIVKILKLFNTRESDNLLTLALQYNSLANFDYVRLLGIKEKCEKKSLMVPENDSYQFLLALSYCKIV